MPQFKSKTVIVEAMRYDGNNCDEIIQWMGCVRNNEWTNIDESSSAGCNNSSIWIKNSEGLFSADKNSWIICIDGEYLVRSDSFMTKHYDIIEEWV